MRGWPEPLGTTCEAFADCGHVAAEPKGESRQYQRGTACDFKAGPAEAEGAVRGRGCAMARLGALLFMLGLGGAVASAAPFVYVVATSDDPTINPAPLGMLMTVGGFVGLLVAAFGGVLIYRARRGKWPPGF